MTALLIKESVNQTSTTWASTTPCQACFTLHQLNHSHWAEVHDNKMPAALPEDGIQSWRDAGPIVPAVKDQVKAPVPAP